MLVDTHCHLGDERFDDDRRAVIERARAMSVGHVIVIADSADTTPVAIETARRYGLSATAGVHPHVAATWSEAAARVIEAALNDPAVVAVGEIGLDYHYEHSPRSDQRRTFAQQLELAARRGLPAVVHAREADDDMVAMLRDTDATVVLHSFSSGPGLLDLALERRHYVSFSGMITFRSWTDVEAVQRVPSDRILVETDAPYLAPVPHRGSRNEPAFVTAVADRLAELRDAPAAEIAADTTANAARCFGARVLAPFPESVA